MLEEDKWREVVKTDVWKMVIIDKETDLRTKKGLKMKSEKRQQSQKQKRKVIKTKLLDNGEVWCQEHKIAEEDKVEGIEDRPVSNVEVGQEEDITADVEENNCLEGLTWLTGQEQWNIEVGKGFVSENVKLSDRILTNAEIKVLSKGLNFCPTPKEINKFELVKDSREFRSRMKCKAAFYAKGD